jgi:hypothetical protein
MFIALIASFVSLSTGTASETMPFSIIAISVGIASSSILLMTLEESAEKAAADFLQIRALQQNASEHRLQAGHWRDQANKQHEQAVDFADKLEEAEDRLDAMEEGIRDLLGDEELDEDDEA